MPRLNAHDAIAYAERYGLTLDKHADPTEPARDGLTPDQAREIATEDPSLIYLDTDHPKHGEPYCRRCRDTTPPQH